MEILARKYFKKGYDQGLEEALKKNQIEQKAKLIDNKNIESITRRFAIIDLIGLLNSDDDLELLNEIESTLIKYIELK